jgi:DNA-binding beta-propeller fold protein YncE
MFRDDGTHIGAWGEAGDFEQPHSVHFGPDGTVWATDPSAHAVYQFSREGDLLMTLGTRGVAGDDTSRDAFNRPAGLVVAANGDVFVADGYVNARIVQFDRNGTFVRIIGGRHGAAPGELQLPHSVAITAANELVVGDSDNKRVAVFAMDGRFLRSMPSPSRGGIAVTGDGAIMVSDVNAGAVTVLRNGAIADVIRVGNRPHGLAVDPRTGDVYVASTVPGAPAVTKAVRKRPPEP